MYLKKNSLEGNDLKKISIELKEGFLPDSILQYVDTTLKEKIRSGDIFFDTDTSYRILHSEVQILKGYPWIIFLVQGEFKPSETSFSLCGAYLSKDRLCSSYNYSINDVYTDLKYCEVSTHYIKIFGKQSNDQDNYEEMEVDILCAFHPNFDIR